MTRPLGKRQLGELRHLAGPWARVSTDAVLDSLIRRGLAAVRVTGQTGEGLVHITAAGLRALADAADAGAISLDPLAPNHPAPDHRRPTIYIGGN